MYFFLFLVRLLPFWAVPTAVVFFELGIYHYNRRERFAYSAFFAIAGFLTVASIIWLVFEGYWRAGPFFYRIFEMTQKLF